MKASHNSATGQRPLNFWAKWFGFIARCQTKTLEEQWEEGVRLFDIRVRYDKYGVPRCCHGLAMYDMTLFEALSILDKFGAIVMVTYEGHLPLYARRYFVELIRELHISHYPFLKLGNISMKKPEWKILDTWPTQPEYKQNYTKIVGWKALLPFPRLWHWLNPPKQVKDNEISMEDFV